MLGLLPQVRSPAPQVPARWPDLLKDRRFTAVANILVFTPYAIYLARGKRPPGWLIAASLAYLAVSFMDDVRFLVQTEPDEQLGQIAHPPPPWRDPAPESFMRYRVNR